MPLPPDGEVAEFDREAAENVLRAAIFAAEMELMSKPVPDSSVRNPDGSPQPETESERTDRLVRAALFHLLEQNLVVLPGDIAVTLDGWIPVERVGTDDA